MYVVFFLFWVVLNGRITAEIAVFGVVIAAAMYAFICRFMGYSFRKDMKLIRKLPLLAAYFIVLVIEIIKANIVMMQYTLSPKIQAEPVLVQFHADLKSQVAQVILANSITLTPGTITVDMKDGDYYVHCYDKSMGEGIDASVFVSMLKKLEG